MASSCLVSFSDIPVSSLTVTSSAAYLDDYAVENLFEGRKYGHGILAANATSLSIDFDLGLGASRTVDHLIVGNGFKVKSAGVTTVYVAGSTDGSTWVPQIGTNAGLGGIAMLGPRDRDFVATTTLNNSYLTSPGSYRYWRFLASGTTNTMVMSKVFFGQFWDPGKEPDYFEWEAVGPDGETWRYPRGQVIMSRSGEVRHRVTLEWDAVTDAAAQGFLNNVLANSFHRPVFLYTASYLDPLFGEALLFCRAVAGETSVEQVKQDVHNIKAVFEEVVV